MQFIPDHLPHQTWHMRGRARRPLAPLSQFVLVLAALACLHRPVHAQAARVSAHGNVISIVSRGAKHRITLPDSVRVDADTIEVLDSQNVLSTSYLLVTLRGPSRRGALGAGMCGAGSETAIVWLELLAWRLQHYQSQLVESCLENAFITGTIAWTSDAMRMTFVEVTPAASTHYVLRYDRLNAERGFTVTADSAAK